MDDILQVAKNYSREKHIELLPTSRGNILDSLEFLFDEVWERYIEKAEDTSAVCLLFATAGALLSKSFNGTDPVSGSL